MRNNIEETKKGIRLGEEFLTKYGEKLAKAERTYLWVSDSGVNLSIHPEDCAIIGEVFGKSGWTRKMNGYRGEKFDWHKTVDGVKITIHDAEDCDLNDSPVPEKAFPILLQQ